MTIPQLVQLYAPLAGLLLMAFWTGGLSVRVATLEREERDRKTTDRQSATDDLSDHDRLVRMETKMGGIETNIEKIGREMAGVQRSLGNITSRGIGFEQHTGGLER